MSSYLTFYGRFKGVEKPKSLFSFSRNSEIYQAFTDYITYIGDGENIQYTPVTKTLLSEISNEVFADKENYLKTMNDYIEASKTNVDAVPYIKDYREMIEEADEVLNFIEVLKQLDISSYSDMQELVANID